MLFPIHIIDIQSAVAAFGVGVLVGITGMGGGALMTPALIFLGVGRVSDIVTADLTAAAIYKTSGAAIHYRDGSPNIRVAVLLMSSSIPMAFVAPHLLRWVCPTTQIDTVLTVAIGLALLFAAVIYALRLYIQLRKAVKRKSRFSSEPLVRPVPTILIGALVGLLVGMTSVGAGSVIMIALVMLYPTLAPVKVVATDLLQAVPLVLSAAISNIFLNGLNYNILIPLTVGSVPGCIIGAKLAPKLRPAYIRRGIVVVLTMSGLALLDKVRVNVLGAEHAQTHPGPIALIGITLLALIPLVWGLLRRSVGLAMFGPPTIAQLEESSGG